MLTLCLALLKDLNTLSCGYSIKSIRQKVCSLKVTFSLFHEFSLKTNKTLSLIKQKWDENTREITAFLKLKDRGTH